MILVYIEHIVKMKCLKYTPGLTLVNNVIRHTATHMGLVRLRDKRVTEIDYNL